MIKGGKILKSRDPSPFVEQTMVKKVNIIARIPVRTVIPNIYGSYQGIMMSTANICKCLMHRATVEEILPDGSTIRLNMQNFNKINSLEDPVVQEGILENRQNAAGMGKRSQYHMTMENIVNHTAPLPRSHYLYSVKDKCDATDFTDPHVAEEQDHRQVYEAAEQSITPPDRMATFPVASEDGDEHSSLDGDTISEDDRRERTRPTDPEETLEQRTDS